MNGCFSCVGFNFLSTTQEISWEERLKNDILCQVGCLTIVQSKVNVQVSRVRQASAVNSLSTNVDDVNFSLIWA